MLDKLAEVEKRYEELERLMSDPQLLNQQREYSKLAKERAELEEIVARFREWRKVEQEIQENRQLLEENDEAIRELAKEEVASAAPAQRGFGKPPQVSHSSQGSQRQ